MIRIIITDIAGNYITDPEGAINHATGIQIETAWPKGFMKATFQVRRSDIFASWIIRESYGVLIYDDATIIFDGRIESMPRVMAGVDEYITVECVGWYCVLEERDLQKRWIDINVVSKLDWPAGTEKDITQNTWVAKEQRNVIQVFAGTGDVRRTTSDMYRLYYLAPSGTIRKILFGWMGRSGEGLKIFIYNNAANAYETFFRAATRTVISGNFSYMMALTATRAIEIRVGCESSDTYDQNDLVSISDPRIECNYESGHRAYSNPLYKQGELVEDVILLANQKGAQLSTDFARWGEPGFVLDPFTVEEPTYCGQVIEKILSYGDASLNTWGVCVWDRGDTSDGKPRVVLEKMDVSDYEYVVSLLDDELAALSYERPSDGLHNHVTVGYVDSKNFTRYRTGADNAALTDSTSITNEYRRDYYTSINEGDATRADYVGSRYISYHKDRRTRGSISIRGEIELKSGGNVPASFVRAGQRIKLLNTGEVFFIRSTSFDAETQTVRISPDLPEDNLAMLLVQRERGFGRLAK